MFLRLTPLLWLLLALACTSGPNLTLQPADAPATPAAVPAPAPGATPAPGTTPVAASGAPTEADLSQTWYVLGLEAGAPSSRSYCDAVRQMLTVKAGKLSMDEGQETMELVVTGVRADPDALRLTGTGSGGDPQTWTFTWADPSHVRLSWTRPDGTREEGVRPENPGNVRILDACCEGPEGDIPEEVAVVPRGQPCPKGEKAGG